MHGDDPPQAHGLDVLVGELLPDEAGYLGVGLLPLALVGLGPDLAGDPVVVREELPLEHGDLGGDTRGGLEVRRSEDLLGVVEPEAPALETGDPGLAGGPVARDREVDDAVLLAPGAGGFGDHHLANVGEFPENALENLRKGLSRTAIPRHQNIGGNVAREVELYSLGQFQGRGVEIQGLIAHGDPSFFQGKFGFQNTHGIASCQSGGSVS